MARQTSGPGADILPVGQWRFWLGGVIVFAAILYALSNILLPFVVGMAVAYFLDPVADKMEAIGLHRAIATLLILTVFFAAAGFVLMMIVPLLEEQLVSFLGRLPGYMDAIRERLEPLFASLNERFGEMDVRNVGSAAGGQAGAVFSWLGGILGDLLGGGVAFLKVLSLIFITPIAAFYLLYDWDLIVAKVDNLLPRDHQDMIREQFALVDSTLSGFVRGVTSVCLILAVFYGLCLTFIGLEFGLMIGIGAGLLSFIPYVGAIVGFLTGIGVAYFQFGAELPMALVAATFFAGQFLEGNLLTPKLVGERVNLHPAWILFALLAGGALFGFVGVLLAVPVASVIGVFSRFGTGQYLNSSFYLGQSAAKTARAKPAKKSAP